MQQTQNQQHPGSAAGQPLSMPQVGQTTTVYSEQGTICKVDPVHADSTGRYVRYYVRPCRADWPGGAIPVRRYIEPGRMQS
jgi:hypothetical protein